MYSSVFDDKEKKGCYFMNSTSIKIKRFFSNRNTVTILCAIIGIAVLFFAYSWRVNNAVKPVSIPYAKVDIQPRTRITEDMIGNMDVPSDAINTMGGDTLITTREQIIDHYSNINTMIPRGSLFYNGAVVSKEELPDHAVYDVKEGEVLYKLSVNMDTSYVNSIVPGGYIDLYMTTSGNGQVYVGKFVEKIKVLDVLTSNGERVFENLEEARTPAYILFSIPTEIHTYLLKARQINGLNVFPVPINETPDADSDVNTSNITSTQLKTYIDGLASEFSQDRVDLTESTDSTNKTDNEKK